MSLLWNSLDKIAVVYKFYNMIQKINSSLDGESRTGPCLYTRAKYNKFKKLISICLANPILTDCLIISGSSFRCRTSASAILFPLGFKLITIIPNILATFLSHSFQRVMWSTNSNSNCTIIKSLEKSQSYQFYFW